MKSKIIFSALILLGVLNLTVGQNLGNVKDFSLNLDTITLSRGQTCFSTARMSSNLRTMAVGEPSFHKMVLNKVETIPLDYNSFSRSFKTF